MFAIGDKRWPGISKLVEEIGELGQVLGKLMGSRGRIIHWSGNLMDKLYEEMGDVYAALDFVVEKCNLSRVHIERQRAMKLEKFRRWHKEDPET